MSHTPKILIVDDEPRMCESLEILLSGHGYEIHTRNSGKEAIGQLSRGNFDLIILDIVMPEVDGFKVMEHIKDRGLNALVIVMTGNASIESAVEALRKGAYDYFRKPFEQEELLKTIKNALNQQILAKSNYRLHEKLHESEEKFRQLFESERDALTIFDVETGLFEGANRAALNLYGYKEPEFLKLKVEEISAEPEETKKVIPEIVNGTEPDVTFCYHKKKNGTVFPVEITNGIFEIKGRKKILGAVRDITDRKQAEEALQESEEKYRSLVEDQTELVCRFSPDGTFVFVNDAYCHFFKKTKDDLIGKKWHHLFSDFWRDIIETPNMG